MKQKTFGFYFFQKSKSITKSNFSVEQCPCQNATVSRKSAAKTSCEEASLSLCCANELRVLWRLSLFVLPEALTRSMSEI